MKLWLTGLMLLVFLFDTSAQDREISFFNIFDGTFTTTSAGNIEWMADSRHYTGTARMNSGMEIRIFDTISGEFDVLVTTDELRTQYPDAGQIQDYQLSKDEEKVLIRTDIESEWPHRSKSNNFVFDRNNGEFSKLGAPGKKQQFAELSPDGKRAAFVQDNNLYWTDLLHGGGETVAITEDGELNKIINGSTDWVYKEEFGLEKAWFWSPDSEKIAFYRFDESEVHDHVITTWNGTHPDEMRLKYPRAGEDNADIQIGIYSINSNETAWLEMPDDVEYIPRIQWIEDVGVLAVRTLNRLQNHLKLFLVDTDTEIRESVWEKKDDAWIEIDDNLKFLSGGDSFIYTSDEDGYNHLYHYDISFNSAEQITSGEWEVTELVGIDENTSKLYYISTEVSPIERHIYRINLDGTGKERLSYGNGWNKANMSPDFRFYFHHHSRITTPPVYTLRNSDGVKIRTLEDNQGAVGILERFRLPEVSFQTLELDNAGDLNAVMITPPDFDPGKKYPLLLYVYGGPGSQSVTDYYRMGHTQIWHYYLATKGYVIVTVDNRGTRGRGRDFMKQIYRKLGQYDTADQIEAARYLSRIDYIDEERIGIWGWSYGGYISTLALAEGEDVFSMAIAVAPVTHWRFYDTIYTERYMQTPEMNEEGYEIGAPVNRAGNITGDYLLIHGMSDEDVHFQNSVEMTDALIRHNIQFQSMFYPNRNHGIYGGNTRLHLYRLMTDFIMEKL